MNMSGLSFNALPPIDLPFRFFISAPLFIIACAFLIFFSGESLWLSRWTPSMLALTHGFTLGFLTTVIMGALLQLLPVIGGIGIAKPRLVASISHILHCFGVVFLMLAFIFAHQWLFLAAVSFLALGIGLYIAALTWVLVKKLSQGDSIVGFRFAIIAFAVLLVLGLALLSRNIELGYSLPFISISSDKHLTDIHALWGLVGWASLLIFAVSFQVLPMFHVAPSFPKIISRFITWLLFSLLVLFVFVPWLALPMLFIAHGIFAISLFYVISKRKRKVPDTTIRYWQLAATSLLLINIIYFLPDNVMSALLGESFAQQKVFLLAAIFIYFYLVSVIQGMLLKILPFLSYTHLQQRCLMDFSAMKFLPHMHEFLNKQHGVILYYMHLFTGLSLLLVLFNSSFYWLFASLLLVEFLWLFFLMSKTMYLYFSINKKIILSCVD
jgi:hypothetical protein